MPERLEIKMAHRKQEKRVASLVRVQLQTLAVVAILGRAVRRLPSRVSNCRLTYLTAAATILGRVIMAWSAGARLKPPLRLQANREMIGKRAVERSTFDTGNIRGRAAS